MDDLVIARLATAQAGLVARRQLRALGCDRKRVRNQVAARRWAERSSTVVSTFTGPLSREATMWLGALHAGADCVVGGLSALEVHGLRGWHRDDVTVLVDDEADVEPLPGLVFARTRRPLRRFRDRRSALPLARVEPAALLLAGYERSPRTAQGLLAATVQQRLTTPTLLLTELAGMRPLRRAPLFRATLRDLEGGAQSLAEVDLLRVVRRFGLPRPRQQRRRRDSRGRLRFVDCEWVLADGTVLALEVDGAFHMEVEHWEDDLARQRRLSGPGRVIVRCSARELRDRPEDVVADLQALGLPRRGGQRAS
ncbi:hypothetical protein SAMN04488570_2108 [Nocardioides scoriae]|uniref:DUF559 domain-containing protein n=1 Tax=Nocardioides scoriae TaxID=642780 RepID=A0A1H1T182_9ACTN|nr:hypothetical protein [Nocardioides scoriae]SDS53921.1 hypothetical protein SAMN04488570_2108 [Nocardioides scoriae]